MLHFGEVKQVTVDLMVPDDWSDEKVLEYCKMSVGQLGDGIPTPVRLTFKKPRPFSQGFDGVLITVPVHTSIESSTGYEMVYQTHSWDSMPSARTITVASSTPPKFVPKRSFQGRLSQPPQAATGKQGKVQVNSGRHECNGRQGLEATVSGTGYLTADNTTGNVIVRASERSLVVISGDMKKVQIEARDVAVVKLYGTAKSLHVEQDPDCRIDYSNLKVAEQHRGLLLGGFEL